MKVSFPKTNNAPSDTPTFVYKDIDLGLNRVEPNNRQLQKTAEVNDIDILFDKQAVLNSLTTLFTTKPGEKALNPLYGASLEQFLFEPKTSTNKMLITQLIQEGIHRWEPRITLQSVDVSDSIDGTVNVTIGYTIPSIRGVNFTNLLATTGGITINGQ